MREKLQKILSKHLFAFSRLAIGILVCLLIALQSGYAQEVDKGRSNKKKLRETKFKTRNRQGEKNYKGDITGRKKRIKKTKNKSKITSPSSNPYGNALYRGTNRKKEGKQVQKSDGYFNIPSKSTENHRKGDISRTKVRKSVTRTGEGKSVKAPSNPYAGRKNQTERQKAKSSMAHGGGFQSISSAGENDPKKRKRIRSKTASGAFIVRKKVNAYAGKPRRGERAKTKDIAGRKLRTKNFKSGRRPVIKPSFNPYFAKKRKGDQVRKAIKGTGYASISKKGEQKYRGRASGGHSTASKKGENAWRKDITGRDFKRPADPGIVTGKKGKPYNGGIKSKPISINGALKNNNGRAVTKKGSGGSISGKIKRGKGKAIITESLGNPKIGGFSGNVKGYRKPLKGGGSITSNVSGKKGKALRRENKFENPKVSRFSGNVKGYRKPLKGGGSITGNISGRQGKPLPKEDKFKKSKTSRFAGNVKGYRKPLKGGGSITGNISGRQGKALPKEDKLKNPKISRFSGNMKGYKKPLKGGGSISRAGWNNDGNPLRKKPQSFQNLYASDFKGRFKRKKTSPKSLGKDAYRYRSALNIKSKYKDKPHAVDDALKAKKPHRNMFQMSGYQGTMKDRRRYSKKPNAHEDAIKGVAPKKAVSKLDSYVSRYKKVRYSKKPNAHENALKGIAPKNSASKAMAFQGNFKVKKNYNKNMHPSSKYTTSLQPRNSLEEKKRTFKFNIWWAKLFKKNENQPPAVKEKTRSPRYDKREKDLWYD